MRNKSPDCACPGQAPTCAVCVAAIAIQMRREHPDTLSVGMLKRRLPPHVDGFTAAVAVEMSRVVLTGSPAHAANRERRYVERPPTDGG